MLQQYNDYIKEATNELQSDASPPTPPLIKSPTAKVAADKDIKPAKETKTSKDTKTKEKDTKSKTESESKSSHEQRVMHRRERVKRNNVRDDRVKSSDSRSRNERACSENSGSMNESESETRKHRKSNRVKTSEKEENSNKVKAPSREPAVCCCVVVAAACAHRGGRPGPPKCGFKTNKEKSENYEKYSSGIAQGREMEVSVSHPEAQFVLSTQSTSNIASDAETLSLSGSKASSDGSDTVRTSGDTSTVKYEQSAVTNTENSAKHSKTDTSISVAVEETFESGEPSSEKFWPIVKEFDSDFSYSSSEQNRDNHTRSVSDQAQESSNICEVITEDYEKEGAGSVTCHSNRKNPNSGVHLSSAEQKDCTESVSDQAQESSSIPEVITEDVEEDDLSGVRHDFSVKSLKCDVSLSSSDKSQIAVNDAPVDLEKESLFISENIEEDIEEVLMNSDVKSANSDVSQSSYKESQKDTHVPLSPETHKPRSMSKSNKSANSGETLKGDSDSHVLSPEKSEHSRSRRKSLSYSDSEQCKKSSRGLTLISAKKDECSTSRSKMSSYSYSKDTEKSSSGSVSVSTRKDKGSLSRNKNASQSNSDKREMRINRLSSTKDKSTPNQDRKSRPSSESLSRSDPIQSETSVSRSGSDASAKNKSHSESSSKDHSISYIESDSDFSVSSGRFQTHSHSSICSKKSSSREKSGKDASSDQSLSQRDSEKSASNKTRSKGTEVCQTESSKNSLKDSHSISETNENSGNIQESKEIEALLNLSEPKKTSLGDSQSKSKSSEKSVNVRDGNQKIRETPNEAKRCLKDLQNQAHSKKESVNVEEDGEDIGTLSEMSEYLEEEIYGEDYKEIGLDFRTMRVGLDADKSVLDTKDNSDALEQAAEVNSEKELVISEGGEGLKGLDVVPGNSAEVQAFSDKKLEVVAESESWEKLDTCRKVHQDEMKVEDSLSTDRGEEVKRKMQESIDKEKLAKSDVEVGIDSDIVTKGRGIKEVNIQVYDSGKDSDAIDHSLVTPNNAPTNLTTSQPATIRDDGDGETAATTTGGGSHNLAYKHGNEQCALLFPSPVTCS